MKTNDLDPRNSLDKQNPRVLAREVFYKGRDIVQQGDEGFRAYYIEKGRVEVIVEDGGKQVKVSELTAGDVFGEMALINKDRRSATVRAVVDTTVTIISRDEIEGKIKSIKDEPIRALINVLAERIRDTSKGQLEHYHKLSDVEQRLKTFASEFESELSPELQQSFQTKLAPILKILSNAATEYDRS